MPRALSLLGGLCLAVCLSPAATITNIVVVNNSTADYAHTGAGWRMEFRSGNTSTSAVNTVGNLASFTNQFGWFLGAMADGFPDGDLMAEATVSYEIFFTVDDPLNGGYILAADSDARGWLSARWSLSPSPGDGSMASASGTDLAAHASRGGTYVAAPNLDVYGSMTFADENSSDANDLVMSSGSALAGIQVGTAAYSLRFTGLVSTVSISGGAAGEAALRFGQNPALPGFNVAVTPGADGEDLGLLGHFVTVRMLSFDPRDEVPEPGTVFLLAAGLTGLAVWRRVRR